VAGVILNEADPSDVEALKALVLAQKDALDARDVTIAEQRELIRKLEHNVEVFRRLAFGRGSDKRGNRKLPADGISARQGHLFLVQLIEEAERTAEKTGTHGTIEIAAPKPDRKPSKRRQKLPSHLPKIRTIYELPPEQCVCVCGGQMHEIGEELRTELERVELTVAHEIAQKKYACRKCQSGVKTARGPARVIDKGLLSAGFLAHLIAERFGMHLPYHRMEQQYAAEGLDLSRSVLQRSAARCAELLEPIYAEIGRAVVASPVVHTDDTPVTVAQAENGRTMQGRVWVYADHENRIWYDFTPTRNRDGPRRVLGDFKGYLQADAYGGYDQLYVPDGATEVACWAHARRKFVDAQSSDPALAEEILERIGKLYGVERDVKARAEAEQRAPTADEFLQARRESSVTQLEAIRAWLELTETKVLPKSPMAEAIRYCLNQWQALVRFVEDGRLQIDNNLAERALRHFAIGRKNWLFFQTEGGGKTASILATLLHTAKAAGVDPKVYFRDVLLRIDEESDVTKLTPHGWKQHFAKDVADHQEDILCRLRDHFAEAK
jgi:transposase